MHMIQGDIVEGAGRTRLTPSDESFDGEDITVVEIAHFLVLQELLDLLIFLTYHPVFIIAEELVETIDEVHEAHHLLISHGDISRCLVCHVHIMSLLFEASECATHRDNIIVGMR